MAREFSGCSRREEAMQEAYEESRKDIYRIFGLCACCVNHRICEFEDENKVDKDECELFVEEEG